jgi:hypothetical protein
MKRRKVSAVRRRPDPVLTRDTKTAVVSAVRNAKDCGPKKTEHRRLRAYVTALAIMDDSAAVYRDRIAPFLC